MRRRLYLNPNDADEHVNRYGVDVVAAAHGDDSALKAKGSISDSLSPCNTSAVFTLYLLTRVSNLLNYNYYLMNELNFAQGVFK
ncbi:hypothetical protein GQX74_012706 [Glossina fuscipes]|nr:hypothetical protein GQX74_012706 [Glossina fuscipes]